MGTNSLVAFLSAAGRLKQIKRTGWVQAGVSRPESVADHSHRVALLTMVLSDMKGFDTPRALRMALLHDLPEAVTGDLTPKQKHRDHVEAETRVFQEIVGSLDDERRSLYIELFREYQEGRTREATLVHVADKLEMVLQALEYQEEGVEPGKLDQFWDVNLPEEYCPLLSALEKLRAG